MCGRYTLRSSIEELAGALEATRITAAATTPRYNIAPTQSVATVREAAGERELTTLKWGLVPRWAKDSAMGARLINARAETVTEKPAFREAFRRRRCLIPADGFFEWQRQGTKKQPFYFRMKGGQVFAFAGLWEHWEGKGGETIESCTMLTTEANEVVKPIHDRMPVIIAAGDYQQWLDAKTIKTEKLTELLRPYPAAEMASHPVGLGVNNPRYDREDLIAPSVNSR